MVSASTAMCFLLAASASAGALDGKRSAIEMPNPYKRCAAIDRNPSLCQAQQSEFGHCKLVENKCTYNEGYFSCGGDSKRVCKCESGYVVDSPGCNEGCVCAKPPQKTDEYEYETSDTQGENEYEEEKGENSDEYEEEEGGDADEYEKETDGEYDEYEEEGEESDNEYEDEEEDNSGEYEEELGDDLEYEEEKDGDSDEYENGEEIEYEDEESEKDDEYEEDDRISEYEEEEGDDGGDEDPKGDIENSCGPGTRATTNGLCVIDLDAICTGYTMPAEDGQHCTIDLKKVEKHVNSGKAPFECRALGDEKCQAAGATFIGSTSQPTSTPTVKPTSAPTSAPTTSAPTTSAPTTSAPTTSAPTTSAPTTSAPTTVAPTKTPTESPTAQPTEAAEPTESPTLFCLRQTIKKCRTIDNCRVVRTGRNRFQCWKVKTLSPTSEGDAVNPCAGKRKGYCRSRFLRGKCRWRFGRCQQK